MDKELWKESEQYGAFQEDLKELAFPSEGHGRAWRFQWKKLGG